jgi:exodeoxyribonuclease VII large subunit
VTFRSGCSARHVVREPDPWARLDPPGECANNGVRIEAGMEQQAFHFEERQVYAVSEIVGRVRKDLESGFRDIWVQGEISNLRCPPSGHLYFTLKDDESQISAVCFRMRSRYLKFQPEDGLDVIVRGTVTVYPPRGQLQLMIEHMEPVGRGGLQLAFEQLKARLQAEGLFEESRKRRLPLLPVKIGVVTSPTGAAIQDILRVLKRRNDRVSVLIYPTRVQGKSAAAEIAAGIDYMNTRSDLDVLIVGRGGGSLEDLWPFNEEEVARAIFRSEIPVISAVGHEIDFTIADFVADLRAPTPSAAAEIVSGKRSELLARLEHLARRNTQAVRAQLYGYRRRFERVQRSRGFVDVETRLRFLQQRLDENRLRLQTSLGPRLQRFTQRTEAARKELEHRVRYFLQARTARLSTCSEKLQAFSPLRVLERGYAIVTNEQGRVIRDPDTLTEEELIHVRVARGRFRARKED